MSDAEKAEMAERVRSEALHAWSGYKRYAWGHDALKPLSKKPFDWYGDGHSLLMTPVDALDTLTLMGLKPQADEAREVIDTKLNLDQDIYVKDFEITIRLLGSLVSCYEMTGDKRLLELADDLGRRMLPMFDSPTGMPYEYVNLHTGAVRGIRSNPAEIGSLLIEYGMLARLTGKQEYYDKAKRAVVELYKRRSPIGLVGSEIDVETGKWTDPTAGIMGGIDSYYEYLLKASILFDDKDCARMWQDSANAIDKYLSDEQPSGLWYGQADMNSGKRTHTFYGALDAFFPAVLALGDDVHRAEQLQDSSYKMWNLAGIEPEQLDYVKMQITGPGYELRPEIIESTYYLYHYTHDPRYLAMGKSLFRRPGEILPHRRGVCRTGRRAQQAEKGLDGELLFCRDAEVPLSALCAGVHPRFRFGHLQHRGASDEAQPGAEIEPERGYQRLRTRPQPIKQLSISPKESGWHRKRDWV